MTSDRPRGNNLPSSYLPSARKDVTDRIAALQGALHAFSHVPTTTYPLPIPASGTNAARFSASTVGKAGRREEGFCSKADTKELQRTEPSVKNLGTSSGSCSRKDARRAVESREQSPSQSPPVFAVTSKRPPTQGMFPSSTLRSGSCQPPTLKSTEVLGLDQPVDASAVGDTDTLIKLFESKQKADTSPPIAHSVRYVAKHTLPDANSEPTELPLSLGSSTTPSLHPLSSTTSRKTEVTTRPVKNSNVGTTALSAKGRLTEPSERPASTARSRTISSRQVSEPLAPHKTILSVPLDGSQDSDGPSVTSSQSSKAPKVSITDPTEVFLNETALDISSRPVRSQARPALPIRHTEPAGLPLARTSKTISRPVLGIHKPTQGLLDPLQSARTPVRSSDSYVPQLSVDSLANAMVASSLASSRAPSPSKPPALPPPRRHGKNALISHHHGQAYSRTPSPARRMRQTMREPLQSDEEDHRKHRVHHVRKHPNKHHEGDRKRYMNQVTERERKRYEGVWAANKGLLLDANSSNAVINIVVRDIWKRSRLSDDVLEEVWDLVDTQGVGKLARDEFVVGMFLIDQRLKGNKLPFKVSDSTWSSVRHLNGVNVSKG